MYITAGFEESKVEGTIRFTFIVAERTATGGYRFVGGRSFDHLREDTLRLRLGKGNYVVYLKAYY